MVKENKAKRAVQHCGTAPGSPVVDVSSHPLLIDVAVGLFAGLVATQITNLAQGPLRWVTPTRVTLHEKLVRPGASSSLVAAQKLSRELNGSFTPQTEKLLGTTIHFAIGIAWGPVYNLLRRYLGLRPVGAALASGAAMSLVLDEGLVPILGLSAPNRHYPTLTRIRGLLAHLVYGTAAALTAEGVGYLVSQTRKRQMAC